MAYALDLVNHTRGYIIFIGRVIIDRHIHIKDDLLALLRDWYGIGGIVYNFSNKNFITNFFSGLDKEPDGVLRFRGASRDAVVIGCVCENSNGIQPSVFNTQLEDMAKKNKCKFADISNAASDRMPVVKAFSMLKMFMRNGITFCEAMNMVNY